jgi:6-pyruvoyltetrahydropterin/6-carboxytetrahydropterin synthase
MFRLTREVRFAISADQSRETAAANRYAGYPPVTALGPWFALQLTLVGELDPQTQYLTNIKQIDSVVRERAIKLIADAARAPAPLFPGRLIAELFEHLQSGWQRGTLEALRLVLSPYVSVSAHAEELPMTRMSEKFEFSASHRLHSPQLTDEQNRARYGKCNNPAGHGHNYEVQVILVGTPDARGLLMEIPGFEQIVHQTVIERFDHKNLNAEVPEFHELVPTVENISRVIYRLLAPKLQTATCRLGSVTVWETPKTWCEYSE